MKLFKNNNRNTIQKPSNNIYELDKKRSSPIDISNQQKKTNFRELQKKY